MRSDAALTVHCMDPISAAMSVMGAQQASLALEVGTSLTRKALDEMQTQAATLLATMPPPQPFSSRGHVFDAYA